MSNISLPTWLEPRVIDEDDHEELKRLANGKLPFYFRDITKESIVKFYNKYPRELFYRLLRVLGFYGIKFSGKIAAYSGPQENYPEVLSIDSAYWEEKIFLPEVLPILAPSFRSFGLSKIKQLHGVPVQCVIALSDNKLFLEKIPTYFHATIIQVHEAFFTPITNSFSCEISNIIINDGSHYQSQQTSPSDGQSTAENTIEEYSDQRLSQSIENLLLSSESLDNLRANNIFYIGELVAKNDEELIAILHLKEKSLQEIKVRLWLIGLCTGLKVRSSNSNPVSIDEMEEASLSVETLYLSVRSANCLRQANIKTISELRAKNDKELLSIPHFGRKCLNEIQSILKKIQLPIKKNEVEQCSHGEADQLKIKSVKNESVSLSVDIMNLSIRSANCLRQANIKTISELRSKNDKELLSIPYFGRKCLNEIRSKFNKIQLAKKKNGVRLFCIEETYQQNTNFVQAEIFSALKTKISDLLLSVRILGCLNERNIEYIWQLVQLSKTELLENRNLGKKSINELVEVLESFGFGFGMRFTPNQLAAIHLFEPTSEPLDLSASMKKLVERFNIRPIPFLNDRENLIVDERLFKIGKKKTLEELAVVASITRERIRQIEKTVTGKIRQHHIKELRIVVDDFKKRVRQQAGIADLNVLGIDRSEFSAKEQIIAKSIIQLMDENVFIDWKFGLVSTKGEDWIPSICDSIEVQINEAVPDKFFTKDILAESVEKVCASLGLSSNFCRQNLIKKFYQEKNIRILDNFLCCGRITKQDQIILAFKELFPDGLEVYKKQNLIIEKLKVNDPERFSYTSPRAILARLTDHPDVFLWRRGFFIHKDHIHYDEAIVKDVETWIEQRFDQGHSRFQVDVPFTIFRESLLQGGIPNQYALYTLLRHRNNTRIGQRKFPTIVDLQADIDIQEGILEELESYFLQTGGPVLYLQLKEEFLVKRGWKLYSVQQNITASSEAIYPWHDGSYIHLDHMTVNYAKLEELLDAIRTKLKTIQGAYSLKGARREMSVLWEQACPSASVRTMVKLIRSVDPEDLQIERYFIQYADQLTESVSATFALEEFCLDMGVEVNSHELHEEFCKQRGWSENQYYTAIRKANLFRTGKSTYLHPVTINWNDSLSLAVHQVMESHLAIRNKNNYPHMQIEELIYLYALPDLPQNIQWTRHLLKSISSEFGDLLFFDDAYIAIDNNFDIEDLDDMIGFLIGRHFRLGIAKRAEVEQMLWREGILETGKPIPSDQYYNESSIVFLPVSDEVGLSPTGIERYAQSV